MASGGDVLAGIPQGVQDHVSRQIGYLDEIESAARDAAVLDKKFPDGGRYEREVREKMDQKRIDAEAGLEKFRVMAAAKGIDADAVIERIRKDKKEKTDGD